MYNNKKNFNATNMRFFNETKNKSSQINIKGGNYYTNPFNIFFLTSSALGTRLFSFIKILEAKNNKENDYVK